MRSSLLVVLLALAWSSAFAQQNPITDAQILERGRLLTEQFYKVDLDPVWAACSDDLKTGLGGLEAFREYRLQGIQAYGQELKLLDEDVVTQEDVKFYVRAATFEKRPELAWYVIWAFDPKGLVVFFNIEFAGRVNP